MVNFLVKFKDGTTYTQSFYVNDIFASKDTVLHIQRGNGGDDYLELSILGRTLLIAPLKNIEHYFADIQTDQSEVPTQTEPNPVENGPVEKQE